MANKTLFLEAVIITIIIVIFAIIISIYNQCCLLYNVLSIQCIILPVGTVSVSMTDDSGNTKFLTELGEGEVFGERALIKKEPRNANIVAKGPVECYYLESHAFYSMLGEFVEKFNKINEFRIFRSTAVLTKVSDSRLKTLTSKFTYHRMFSGTVC